MKLYPLHSGNLKFIGWDWNDKKSYGEMKVVFQNDSSYMYWPVPKALWDDFWSPGTLSKGKWFHEKIKNNKDINYKKL